MTSPKDILRQEAFRRRDAVDPAGEDVSRVISLFFDTVNPKSEQVVALYKAKGREFDPSGIHDRLQARHNPCVLPVVQPASRILRFALWEQGDDLVNGPYNILQPVVNEQTKWLDPDIVILPLLAFDSRGNRLGYGGGYYDATLRDLRQRKGIVAAGLAYDEQEIEGVLPTQPHDEPMDWVITPQGKRHFSIT